MTSKFNVLVLASVVLFGCGSKQDEIKRFSLRCGNYDVFIELNMKDDSLQTAINGEKIKMFRAMSGSGVRYEGKGAVVSASVWNKGEAWSLSLDNGPYIWCKAVKK